MSVLFYVSGHGFGHARRVAEIVRAGSDRWNAVVRTTAPARLFGRARVQHAAIDPAVAETADTLRIDATRTRANLQEFLLSSSDVVAREASYVRTAGIRLIVADIPFLAGDIAEAAGVPCIGISNFTWNWILEPHLAGDADGRRLLEAIEGSYARMREYWRIPFSHADGLSMFRRVIDLPLIAPKATLDAAAIREGFDRVVLTAFRGPITEAFRRAAAESPDTLFLTFDAAQAEGIGNARCVAHDSVFSFEDLAAASDVVLAKLGYGIAAGCASGKKRLLYPPRDGFREDTITSVEAARYTALRPIPLDDFEAGRWHTHLDAVLAQPIPTERVRDDGAEVCARRIAGLLNRT